MRSDRPNWGPILKLPNAQGIKVIREWLNSHDPSADGYLGALKWVTRKEMAEVFNARHAPAVERIGKKIQAEQEQRQERLKRYTGKQSAAPKHERAKQQPEASGPPVWGVFVNAAEPKV